MHYMGAGVGGPVDAAALEAIEAPNAIGRDRLVGQRIPEETLDATEIWVKVALDFAMHFVDHSVAILVQTVHLRREGSLAIDERLGVLDFAAAGPEHARDIGRVDESAGIDEVVDRGIANGLECGGRTVADLHRG